MAKKKADRKKPNWRNAEESAWQRHAAHTYRASSIFTREDFGTGFKAGLRAMRRHLKSAK